MGEKDFQSNFEKNDCHLL